MVEEAVVGADDAAVVVETDVACSSIDSVVA